MYRAPIAVAVLRSSKGTYGHNQALNGKMPKKRRPQQNLRDLRPARPVPG